MFNQSNAGCGCSMGRGCGRTTGRGFGRGNDQGPPPYIGGEFQGGGFPHIPPPPGGCFPPGGGFQGGFHAGPAWPPPMFPLVASRVALLRSSKACTHIRPKQVLLDRQTYNSSGIQMWWSGLQTGMSVIHAVSTLQVVTPACHAFCICARQRMIYTSRTKTPSSIWIWFTPSPPGIGTTPSFRPCDG